jgi:hypothetical protein
MPISLNIMNFLGAWSSTTQYAVVQIPSIAGVLSYSCPVVTYESVTYCASSPSHQPVLNTPPTAGAIWSVV